MRHAATVIALLAALLLAACGDDEDSSPAAREGEPLRVAAAFYPIEEVATAVGGERAEVTGLTPAGTGPHDLELEADQLAALEEADVVTYLGSGFQPAIEQAVEPLGDGVVRADLLDGVALRKVDSPVPGVRGEVDGEVIGENKDPHVWVDPARYGELVTGVRDALIEADPDGKRDYERNAAAYQQKVDELDAEFEDALEDCKTRTLVTSHAAFGYLADRYDLDQAPIAGISPEDEPDPRSLAATARKAKADNVKTVYFEELVPRKLSDTVAREIGAESSALNPVEGLTGEQLDAGEDYFSVQRANLDALREGLGCTA